MTGAPIVVRFGALGDLILLTPLLHKLHQRYGQCCQLLGSGAWMLPLFQGHPDVGGLWSLRSRRRPFILDPQQWHLVSELRAHPPGPVYVCDERAIDKVRWLLKRAGIPEDRCLFASDFPMEPQEHWIDRWLRFGDATPSAFASPPFVSSSGKSLTAPKLVVTDTDRCDMKAWLHRRGIAGKPIVVLQPGNKRTLKRGRLGQLGDDKTWPIGNWSALLSTLADQHPGTNFVLCGVRAEAPLLNDIRRAAARDCVFVAAEDLPLRRLFGLLEIARGMISVDTGPAHAAAALGCPLVVLYGAESPSNWLPRSPSGSPVLALGGPPHSSRVADIALSDVLVSWRALMAGSAYLD